MTIDRVNETVITNNKQETKYVVKLINNVLSVECFVFRLNNWVQVDGIDIDNEDFAAEIAKAIQSYSWYLPKEDPLF